MSRHKAYEKVNPYSTCISVWAVALADVQE